MINVSRETEDKLKVYEALVLKWNEKINLVSRKDTSSMWDRHIVDSVQLINYISDRSVKVIDVGSGAGFPAIPLLIQGIRNITLVEANHHKAAFLLQAIKLLDIGGEVLQDRVEKLHLECNILTCRAYAKLNDIFFSTFQIKVNDKYLLLKGQSYQDEINEAAKNWDFEHKAYKSITNENGRILEIYNLKKK